MRAFIKSFPQPEQHGQQHRQTHQVGTGDEQGGLQRAHNGPEFLLGGPFVGLLPGAVVDRLRGSGRLAAMG